MTAFKKKAPDGRETWTAYFRFTDWQGVRRQKKKENFSTRREAQAFERDFLERLAGAPDISFDKLCEKYLDDYKTRVREVSYFRSSSRFLRHVLPAFGSRPVNSITPDDVRAWQASIVKQGFSQNYYNAIRKDMRSAFDFARRYCGLKENPCSLVRAAVPKDAPKQAISFWTLDEYRRFRGKITRSDYIAFFDLLFWSGIRVGEALALTVADVHEGRVHVTKTLSRLAGRDIVTPPKTQKSIRAVALPSEIYQELQVYIDSLPTHTPSHRIFILGRSAILQYMKRQAKAAGVKPIRLHDLRHSHASLLISQGASPVAVRDRLGHTTVQMTLDRYSHLFPSEENAILSRLDGLSKME